ncbi:MAG: hypothetical protein D6698_03080 [Gammaproteobacteria bacterium]|nr:MAG: hypothetical protein D6698_03080 [Gammaproteobacteria bacterium]
MSSAASPATLLVIDQGTHASRAILFSPEGQTLAYFESAIKLHDRGHGRYEQDADEILTSVSDVLCQADRAFPGVKWLALTCQRATLVVWDRDTGKAVQPAISWMDTRATAQLAALRGYSRDIHAQTGLPLSAHYLAAKMACAYKSLHTKPSQRPLLYGPLLSYLLYHLLPDRPFLIDPSVASRTQLYAIAKAQWSNELIQRFGLGDLRRPDLVPSRHEFGPILHHSWPLKVACGDQSAMPFANGMPEADALYVNLGTGAFAGRLVDSRFDLDQAMPLMISPLPDARLPPTKYMLEGSVNGAGSALQWFRQTEGISMQAFREMQAKPVDPANDHGLFINTIGGLGSPWWRRGGPPRFVEGCRTPEARYNAVVASILFMLYHNIQLIMQKTIHLGKVQRIHACGGLSRLPGFCQALANLSQVTVMQEEEPEQTARGAAFLMTPAPKKWRHSRSSVHAPDIRQHQSIMDACQHYLHSLNRYLEGG